MPRPVLIKQFRVLYTDGTIKNKDYIKPAIGKTYPSLALSFAEFDTLAEMVEFVALNGLVTE